MSPARFCSYTSDPCLKIPLTHCSSSLRTRDNPMQFIVDGACLTVDASEIPVVAPMNRFGLSYDPTIHHVC